MRPQVVDVAGTGSEPNTWLRWFCMSVTYTLPPPSTATPIGEQNCLVPMLSVPPAASGSGWATLAAGYRMRIIFFAALAPPDRSRQK